MLIYIPKLTGIVQAEAVPLPDGKALVIETGKVLVKGEWFADIVGAQRSVVDHLTNVLNQWDKEDEET